MRLSLHNYTKLQIPLKIDDKEVWISPHRQGLGGTLVLLAHGAVPRVVLIQLFTVHRKPIKVHFSNINCCEISFLRISATGIIQ
jgi:hypothetical protein